MTITLIEYQHYMCDTLCERNFKHINPKCSEKNNMCFNCIIFMNYIVITKIRKMRIITNL